MEMKQNNISDAFLIAALTILGYWFSFLYEYGYLSYFDIPTEFVSVGLPTIFYCLITAFAITLLFLPIINFIAMCWPNDFRFRNKIFRILLILFVPVVNFLLFRYRSEDIALYIVFGCWLLIFEFLWPIITQSKVKGYFNKIKADEDSEDEVQSKILGSRIIDKFGIGGYSLFLLVFLGSTFFVKAGQANAYLKKDFFQLDDNPKLILIRTYEDIYITKAIMNNYSEFSSGFQIIPKDRKISFKPFKIEDSQERTEKENVKPNSSK